ncbi:ThiJ/PfpI family protein [Panus rudis PR-1116 ss-1]|nr:ThiJ/PfpI family protein [Panus rudis PR-1116 ss-1]
MSAGKVLIILSDAHSFPLIRPDGTVQQEESGFFLSELSKPLTRILDAGYSVTFASPKGREPNVDPLSDSAMLAFFGKWWEKNKANKLIEEMKLQNNLASPRPFASISDAELDSFVGVFIPGGHAPLSDLGDDPELGRILWHFHNKRKPTAALCHGPYAFLSTKHAPGAAGFAYKGYKITSWSNQEEKVVETAKGGTVPKVEDALVAEGAEFVSGAAQKLAGSVTIDRELITGSNPTAADNIGAKFVEALEAYSSAPAQS